MYPREYNQFADKEASMEREKINDKSSGYSKEYYEIMNKNKKLKGSKKIKEKGWIRTGNREFGINFHNYMIWWRFWTNPDEWSSDTPKWRHGSFDFVKLLKGKDTVDREEVFNGAEEIQMPEGNIIAKLNTLSILGNTRDGGQIHGIDLILNLDIMITMVIGLVHQFLIGERVKILGIVGWMEHILFLLVLELIT